MPKQVPTTQIWVRKKTTQIVDPNHLPKDVTTNDIEAISQKALSSRTSAQQLVYVIKGTTTVVDLWERVTTTDDLEPITRGQLSTRKRTQQFVYVMKDTIEEVNPNQLPEGKTASDIEKINKKVFSSRKTAQQSVYVIKGTTTVVDPNHLQERMTTDDLEEITRGQLSTRRKRTKKFAPNHLSEGMNDYSMKENLQKRPKNQSDSNDTDIAWMDTTTFPHEVVIKQESAELNTSRSFPPLSLDELHEVAKILRGNSIAQYNCSKYTMAFMAYFSTRVIPNGPVSSKPATQDDFAVSIKIEGSHILRSKILREHPFFPCNRVPIENPEGVIDVDHPQLAEEVDYYVQSPCDIQCLEQTLTDLAKTNEKQESYGVINFASPIQAGRAGHSVNYYATPTEVYIIDCQLIHRGKGEAIFPIQELANYYCFEGMHQTQRDSRLKTFQRIAFIAPHVDTIHDQKTDSPIESSRLLPRFSNTISDTQLTTTLGIFGEKNMEETSILAKNNSAPHEGKPFIFL